MIFPQTQIIVQKLEDHCGPELLTCVTVYTILTKKIYLNDII